MTKLYHVLDVPIEKIIKKEIPVPYINPIVKNGMGFLYGKDLENHLTDNFINLMKPLNLIFAMHFYTLAGVVTKGKIHVYWCRDDRPFPFGLNVLLKGQGNMRWFNPPYDKEPVTTSNTTIVKEWLDSEKGSCIDEWTSGKVALVRTDIPHSSYNENSPDRHCLSIRWQNWDTWENTIAWFDANIGKL